MKGLLFTYALTYGGAVISLISPFYGLLVYVCFAIVKPDAMWPWAVPPGSYSRIVAIAMLIGWSYSNRATFRFGGSWSVLMLLVSLWAWSIAGAFIAPDQEAAWTFVETLTKIVIPFFIGITTIDSVSRLTQLAWVIVVSQGYVAYEMNVSYFQGYNTLAVSGFAGLDNNSAAIALVTALGLTFFLGIAAPRLWQKAVALGLAALMGHAVLFSFSRGGMLAMIVAAFVVFLLIPKRPKHYLAFALAVMLALYLAGPEVRARFMLTFAKEDGQHEESAQGRIELWGDCWDVMKRRPVFGVGPNHWPLVAPEYGWPLGKEAHSLWMQTGAELGFAGLLLLVSFYLLCITRLWLLIRKPDALDPHLQNMAKMVIVSLAGFVVSAQFVSLEALEIPYYVVLLGAGTLKLATAGSSGDGQARLAGQTVSLGRLDPKAIAAT